MGGLLALSRVIDAITYRIGKSVGWLILAAVIVSAVNATVRFALNMSSNAWLETQWYLFGAVFLLGAGYTLLEHEHIKHRYRECASVQIHARLDRPSSATYCF
jgi:TRAP-type mannitol/chloroaromatic compound transport system permease small subunit